jgi:iron-sulfur cluster repair protein YtfE (RIC family)
MNEKLSVLECEHEWQSRPLSTLVMHISGVYHEHMRDQLPILWRQATGLAAELGNGRAARLRELAVVLTELRDQVETHAWTEDDLLFPVLVAREYPSVLTTTLTPDALTRLVDTLAEEHVAIRRVLARVTAHLNDTQEAAAAVPVWRELNTRIAQLHDRLIEELDLEDRCLLPRARDLARVELGRRSTH